LGRAGGSQQHGEQSEAWGSAHSRGEHSTRDGNYYSSETTAAKNAKVFVFIDFRVWNATC
jgi:hypothetical protein